MSKVSALKAAILTSINVAVQAVLAMSAQASPANNADVAYGASTTTTNGQSHEVMSISTNELEASYVKVPGRCKASHAAFKAVRVGPETIAPEVQSIHAAIDVA